MYQLLIMLVGIASVAGRLRAGCWGALAGLSCVADPREKGDPETRGIQHELTQAVSPSQHSDKSAYTLTDLECQN